MAGVGGRDNANCLRCISEPLEIGWIDSWGRYDSSLTKVLHAFKFRGHAFLAEPLGELLASVLQARRDAGFDVVVPVPMTRAKERKRGYNQAALLARSLSGPVGLRVGEPLLRKLTDRRPQAELKKGDRRANVAGTFEADDRVAGLSVLLVDDICTTGETLSACAGALRKAGAADVAAVTVARTP